MKTISKLALAFAICLSLTAATSKTANAQDNGDQYEVIVTEMIVTEIAELEDVYYLAMMMGDYKTASMFDKEIAELEFILEMGRPENISSGTLGSGRITKISNGDLGSGRITKIAGGDLGSGR